MEQFSLTDYLMSGMPIVSYIVAAICAVTVIWRTAGKPQSGKRADDE